MNPRLRFGDLARAASVGVRTRRLRAALSALGIAIGVAAIVAVLGLSASSQAGLLAEIDRLGTNLAAARRPRRERRPLAARCRR
jgi:putative ABC transport system permease protein